MTALLDRCLVAALSGAPPQPASATAALEAPARVGMPRGYEFFPRDADVAGFLREHARWAVLALACHAESPAQSRAALEWMRENARLDAAARDAAVNDLIILLQGIDLLLILQSDRDVECVAAAATPALAERDCDALRVSVLRTYRQRHIASGMHRPQFARLLATLISANQAARIRADLASILS